MKKILCPGIALVVLLFTSLHSVAQEEPLSSEQITKVEGLIQTEMSQSKIPGLSIR